MIHQDARTILVVGFILVMLGFILPLLEVLNILESTFLLNFFSYAASISGLFMGIIGSAYLVAKHRKK
jgi:hypothetical protein